MLWVKGSRQTHKRKRTEKRDGAAEKKWQQYHWERSEPRRKTKRKNESGNGRRILNFKGQGGGKANGKKIKGTILKIKREILKLGSQKGSKLCPQKLSTYCLLRKQVEIGIRGTRKVTKGPNHLTQVKNAAKSSSCLKRQNQNMRKEDLLIFKTYAGV